VNETWAVVFLGVIAFASLVTMIVEIGIVIEGRRLIKRVNVLTERVEHDYRPTVEHIEAMSRDARRIASLAASQVERLDVFMADAADRLNGTLSRVQSTVAVPVRESEALLAGLRAILARIRSAGSAR
jgi:hypothetical protein